MLADDFVPRGLDLASLHVARRHRSLVGMEFGEPFGQGNSDEEEVGDTGDILSALVQIPIRECDR